MAPTVAATPTVWVPEKYKLELPVLKVVPLASVRPLLTNKVPLSPRVVPPTVTASSVALLLLRLVVSLLVIVPFLSVPLTDVNPPVPKVGAPILSEPAARSSVPVMLKLPAVRLIVPREPSA